MLQVDAKTLRSLRHLIGKEVQKQGWRFAVYFLVIGFAGIASILPPKLYGYFAEHMGAIQSLNEISASAFLHNLLLFGTLIAVTLFFCNFARAVTEEWISLRIEGSLRIRFMSYMHRLPLESFDESQRGDWLTRMSGDIRAVEQFIALRLPNQISDAVVTIAIAVIFISQNTWVALFLILSTAILACVNVIVQARLTPILDELRFLHGEVLQGLLENFEGMRSIRSYRAENFILTFFKERVQIIIEKGLRLIRVIGLLFGSNSFLVNMLTTLALSYVAFKLRNQEILVSDVFLYPFYIGMFYSSIFALVRGVFDWNDFVIHASRLDEVFQSATSDQYLEKAVFQKPFDTLEIKNAVIGYKSYAKLTKPFDFKIQKGEIVVIRGHSGCGKSTFLESLAGLRELEVQSARLFHQNTFVENFPQKDGKVSLPVDLGVYVEQKPYLLEGSLKNNLLLGDTTLSEDRLWSALEGVNLRSFFEKRDGLSFFIKDNGRNLSEGQKQRIGIARSLVHLRSLILLDEPFASLDQGSISVLSNVLNKLKSNHGIVIVSHIIPESLSFDRVVDFDSFVYSNVSKEFEGDNFFQKEKSEMYLAEAPFGTFVECNV